MDNTFEKYDSSYNSNFSFDDVNTEKLDMYGVWIKKKPDSDNEVPPDLQDETIAENDESSVFDNDAAFQEMEPLEDTAAGTLPDLSFEGLETLEGDDDILDLDSFDSEHTDTDTAANDEEFPQEEHFESLDLDDFLDEESVETSETDADTESGAGTLEPLSADFDDEQDMEEIVLDSADDAAHEDEPDSDADLDGFSEISLDDFDDMTESANETVEDFDDSESESPLDLTVSEEDEKNSQQDITEITAQNTDDTVPIFDDVQAVEEELLSERPEPKPSRPARTAEDSAAQDKSTELLLQIASEINGIKAELNSLKESISSKMIASSAASDTPAAVLDEDETQEQNTGFFNDDDTDETISLTGDELNNILITADFTSEEPEEEAAPADDFGMPEVLADDQPDALQSVPAIDSECDTAESEDIEPFEDADEDFLRTDDFEAQAKGEELLSEEPVFNVEAIPASDIPEDLSYLDEETIDDADKLDFDADVDLDDDGFDELTVEDFEIPEEQEVAVLTEEDSTVLTDDDKPVIHEIFTDNDTSDSEAEEEHPDDVFMDASNIPELQNDETFFGADMEEPEAVEMHKTEVSATPAAAPREPKQETLLKAAEQIIKEEQEKVVSIPVELKNEIKSVLAYMDQLLEALPEKKIEEFAKSEYFETYKHLFEELGIS